MTDASDLRVEVVDAAVTRDLRRRVLRSDLPPEATGAMPGDGPDSVHVAALRGDDVVGCVAVLPAPFPERPDAPASFQLRGMAVDPSVQGAGIGSLVFDRVLEEVRRRGARLMWCNARLTALRFYERHGMTRAGEEFISADTGLPHTLMWTELPEHPTSSE